MLATIRVRLTKPVKKIKPDKQIRLMESFCILEIKSYNGRMFW